MSIPSSGSSTWRSASYTSSLVGIPRVQLVAEEPHFLAPLPREEVDPVDETHPVAPGAHDERVRAGGICEKAHAAQEIAIRHAGRNDDHLARRELLRREDTRRIVDAGLARLLDLAPRRRPQLRLQLAAQTAQGGGGHHC